MFNRDVSECCAEFSDRIEEFVCNAIVDCPDCTNRNDVAERDCLSQLTLCSEN